MADSRDSMPGALPLRMSDDQPVDVDRRAYVATGQEVTSLETPPESLTPPPQVELPMRPRVDDDPIDLNEYYEAPPEPDDTPQADMPLVASVRRLCAFVDDKPGKPKPSELSVLRGDIRILTELVAYASETMDSFSKAKRAAPKRKTSQKKKPKRRENK